MNKIEMLMGYDSNNFEKKFEEEFKKISIFTYNYFKSMIGDKVAGMTIEENVLFAWSYYFLNIADESKEIGNKIMVNMIRHLEVMLQSEEDIVFAEEKKEGQLLLLDESLCRIWFKTSICGMIAHLYGEDEVMPAMEYLDHNYFSKNKQNRTLMLTNQENSQK